MKQSKTNGWKQAVIGISDGLIISLAITTAIAIVFRNFNIVLLSGLVLALLGMIVMAVGGYYAAKFRMETLKLKTAEEQQKANKEETEKTIALFKKLNLSKDMQEQAASEIEKDNNEWKVFLQQNRQPFELPNKKQVPVTAVIIGVSFLVGAIFPLLSYIILLKIDNAIQWSVITTLVVLIIVGYIKAVVNAEHKLWGTARLFLLGAIATACTCWVAKIFTP